MMPDLLNNRYQIIHSLGTGGFGETYLAEDTYMPSGRRCVIKRLKPVKHDADIYQLVQERFQREAAILESLGEGSPQIPKLYAYFAEQGQFYLVQEWIEGINLDYRVQQAGPLSEASAKQLLESLLSVLVYVHSQGIIHRDIKPGNIMVRQANGQPVLIDFGIAKETMITGMPEGTGSIIVGTKGFMPLEQALGQPVYASDLYSLGRTTLYLLTGKLPQVQSLDRLNQSGLRISPTFLTVLEKATQPYAQDRYTSAQEMLDALRADPATDLGISETMPPDSVAIAQVAPVLLAPPHLRAAIKPERAISHQEYRNRQILLNKVKNYWIKGVLETSLHGRALLELGLVDRLDVLDRPWGVIWETPDHLQQPLPTGTRIIDKFDQMGAGRTLLILGEPGAGKTTTLLELARDLLQQAEQNIHQPLPVVFNLSSWGQQRTSLRLRFLRFLFQGRFWFYSTQQTRLVRSRWQRRFGKKRWQQALHLPSEDERFFRGSIAEWLVQELNSKYQVSREIAQTWVKSERLLLLLDGLDEVDTARREACVQAINQFSQDFGQTEVVVCSRIGDYEMLVNRFRFQGAILLQPLSPEQIQRYFANAGPDLAAVNTAIQVDTTLQALARSPLMLNIITLAYQGAAAEDLLDMNSTEERHQHLFNAYIERMFNRRGGNQQYSKARSLEWLLWLAQRLSQQSQTVFLIERIQPSWLQTNWQKTLYLALLLISYLLIGGLVMSLVLSTVRGIVSLVLGGLICLLIFGVNRVTPVETLKWSWKNAKNNWLVGIILGPTLGCIVRLIYEVTFHPLHWLIFTPPLIHLQTVVLRGIVFGFSMGLLLGIIRGFTASGIDTITYPNQGIRQSAKNAVLFAVIGFLIPGLAAKLMNWSIFFWGIFGLSFGFAAGGGEACIKHLALRIVLSTSGCIPWNYARFLDYATERIFLQKVGGGYIFVHRLLLEHFALLSQESGTKSQKSE